MCVRRKNLKQNTKSRRTQNTPRNPQQPGDRDHLKTACDETRPTRSPTLVRFHRSRVCGNRPRTALAISKNHESYTYTQTDDSIMAPCTLSGTSREVNEARRPHTCSRPCAFEEKKTKPAKHEKSRPTQDTPPNLQQSGEPRLPRDGVP